MSDFVFIKRNTEVNDFAWNSRPSYFIYEFLANKKAARGGFVFWLKD